MTRGDGPADVDGRITRRGVLRSALVSGTVGIAGCLHDEEPCDLSVTKAHSGGSISYGDTTEFEIAICNEGDETCESAVTVVDDLPVGTTFTGGSGSGWNCSANGGVVTCEHPNSGELDGGDCLPPLTLTVEVGTPDEVGPEIANCVTVEQGNPELGYKEDCVRVPIEPSEGECDLAITKRYDGDSITAESSATFEVEVCNEGDGPCTDSVTVVDGLPAGVTFDSGSGTGWTCTESGGVVTCDHDNTGGLAPGDCLPILELNVGIGSIDETGDQIRNCASVESDDGNASNDSDCATVTVTQPVQGCNGLEIDKVAATQFTYGEQESYEITVCNPTDQACDGEITVTDDIPGGMSFVSASGSGWTASASGGVVTATHPNNGALGPGGCLPTLTLTVDVVPAAQFPGGSDAVQNCAELVVDGAVVAESCVTHVIWNV